MKKKIDYDWVWDDEDIGPRDEDFLHQYKAQMDSETMGYITDMGSSGSEWIFTIEKDGYYYDSSEHDIKFSSFDDVVYAAHFHFESLK